MSVNVKDATLAMHAFFVAYAGDIDGSMAGMSRLQLLQHLGTYLSGDELSADSYEASDVFIGVAAAATGIPEHDFLRYALRFFGHEQRASDRKTY